MNLTLIAEALADYQQVHGTYPPPYLKDQDGRPTHSWRVLILPFLEEKELYDSYDFSQPWNGPNNRKLAQRMPECYRSPQSRDGQPFATTYVAIVGAQTAWPTDGRVQFDDIRDGVSRTILLVEIDNSDIDWMEPRDVTFDEAISLLEGKADRELAGKVTLGGCFVTAAWRVYPLPPHLQPKDLEAALTIDGGDESLLFQE